MPKLFLIPNTLGNTHINNVIPLYVQKIAKELRYFFVENTRNARRYLRKIDKNFPIDNTTFFNIGKNTNPHDIKNYFSQLNSNAGIISDAGLPVVADPGTIIVQIAIQKKYTIIPLAGPSSIFLALTASGFNGQKFSFHGYLPINKNELINKIKTIEKNSEKNNQTQIFIETPYRNNKTLELILKTCNPKTQLCIAKEITTENEKITTKTIENWRKTKTNLHKQNAIFLIYKS